jgi:hypothetical protein
VYALGLAIALVGVGLYEAWWTAAFAIGGTVVGLVGLRHASPTRPLAVGVTTSIAALLGGLSPFLFLGGVMGGGTPWFLAAVGSVVGAVLLVFVARRLLRPNTAPRDIRGR